jgi:hypothetical protein
LFRFRENDVPAGVGWCLTSLADLALDIQHVLTVVDNEERVATRKMRPQHIPCRGAAAAQSQRGHRRFGDQLLIVDRREVDEPDSVGMLGGDPMRDLEGEARLARPARARKGDEPTLAEQRADRVEIVLAADETVEGRRKVALRATGRREHRRVVTPANCDRRKGRETLEVQLAQRHEVVAAPRADERAHGLGGEDLATRGGCAQPCRFHGRHALIVASPFGDIARADADAYAEHDLGSAVASCDPSLNLRCCRDRVPSPAKRRHVAVARALDDLAVMRGDRPGDEHLVLVSHRVVPILPESNQRLCRTDQIGEQQRDRAGP